MSLERDAIPTQVSFVGEGMAASSTSSLNTRSPQRSHDVQNRSDFASLLPLSPSSVRNKLGLASGPGVPNSNLPSQLHSSEELISFFRNYLHDARSSVERVMCDTYDVDCHLEAQESFLSNFAEHVDATVVPELSTPTVDWEARFQQIRERIGHIHDHDRDEPLEMAGTGKGLESLLDDIQNHKSIVSSSELGNTQPPPSVSRSRAPIDDNACSFVNELLEGVRQEFMGISSQLSGQVLQVSIHCRQANNVATEGLKKANCIREEMKVLTQQLRDRVEINAPVLTHDREAALPPTGEDQSSTLAALTARCEKAAKEARDELQHSKPEELSHPSQHQASLLAPVAGSAVKHIDAFGGSETLVTRRDLKEVVEALMEEICQMTMQAMPAEDQGVQGASAVAVVSSGSQQSVSSSQQVSYSSSDVGKSRECGVVKGDASETAFSDFQWQSKQTHEEFKKELRELYKEVDRLSVEMVDTKNVLLADIEVRRSEIALQKEALFREIDSDMQTLKEIGSAAVDRVTQNDLREMADKLRAEFREGAVNLVSRDGIDGDRMAKFLPSEIAAATAAIKEALGESIGASQECERISQSVAALNKLHPEKSDNGLKEDFSAMKGKMEELQKFTAAQIAEKCSSIKKEMSQEVSDKLASFEYFQEIHRGTVESVKLNCDELQRRFDALEANEIQNRS